MSCLAQLPLCSPLVAEAGYDVLTERVNLASNKEKQTNAETFERLKGFVSQYYQTR